MAKVLRGGKWGTISRVSSSRTAADDGREEEEPVDVEDHARDQDSGTIVSFFEECKQLGVACYDLSTNEIYLSKCASDDDYVNAAQVVSQVDACVIVMPKSYGYNDSLLKALRAVTQENELVPLSARNETKDGNANQPATADRASLSISRNSSSNHRPGPRSASTDDNAQNAFDEPNDTLVSYLPNTEFSLTKSAELCGILKVRGMPDDITPDQRLTYLSHLLGEEECVMRAVGGLLSFVLQNGILGMLGTEMESIQISSIVSRNYCNVMKISPTTLRALHVFSQDMHPMGRGTMKGKEGLSLYGILKSKVKTAAARKLLRTWLMFPSTCVETIKERRMVVEALRKSSNSAVLLALKDALTGVKNVPGILWRFKKGTARLNDWKALYSSIKSFVIVQDTLKIAFQQSQDISKSQLLQKSLGVGDHDLRECIGWMDAVVDFEESTDSGRMVVAHGFSDEIDEMKRCYSGLDDFLTTLGIEEHKKFQEQQNELYLPSLQFTYLPQVGYLVVLPEDDCDQIGLDRLEQMGFAFIFRSTDHGYHFKNDRCRELDDELGDIHVAIIDLEEKAFRLLEEKIFSFSGSLFDMATLVRQLDCLQALACCANEHAWTKPAMSEENNALIIEDARHPLVELFVTAFVPNSTNLKFGDVQVLTGPNYSGKSVYLAQIALMVILAQIGSFVPAKKATHPVIHNINSRIASFESVCHGQSSFFIDACHVSRMSSLSEGKSLNLIDEYGKGTSEVDGMALLAATLQDFLRCSVDKAPICICATHFVEILKEPFLPMSSPRLSVSSMEVIVKPNKQGTISEGSSLARRVAIGRRLASEGSRVTRPPSQKTSRHSRTDSTAGIAQDKNEIDLFGSVVRTYRLLPGSICHESRALQCALEAGVPKFILQRAAYIREVVGGTGTVEDAVVSEESSPRMHRCLESVRTLLSTDLENAEDDSSALITKIMRF